MAEPKKKTSRREAKKQMFYEALRVSLEDLQAKGSTTTITQSAVISNAKFTNGKQVGLTTLYGKVKGSAEFIHSDFILELGLLISEANKSYRGKTNGEKPAESTKATLARVRVEKDELAKENESLLAQLAELTDCKMSSSSSVGENRVKSLETDLYIAASLLNKYLDGCINEYSEVADKYEIKYSGQNRLTYAKERISLLERRILDSKITPLFDIIDKY